MTKDSIRLLLASCIASGLLISCGGGGGNSLSSPSPTTVAPSTVTPPAPVVSSSEPEYESGKFDLSTNFEAQCENPRQGRDQLGSSLREKFWLRSWTDETYLWYDEVPDLDPNSIADTIDYFDVLKTSRTTASGKGVDQFHFNINTVDFEARQSGEASAGYGARLQIVSPAAPRDIRIAYTQSNGPAGQDGGFERGDKILIVDGIDAVNGASTEDELATLNDGLFPRTAGESHSFTVEGADGTQREITLESADVVEQAVTATSVIDTNGGNKVGYIHFTTFSPFSAEKAIFDAMTEMETANIDELVLDLRYNGGGLLAVAAQTGFMIAGSNNATGKTFDRLTFNDKHQTRNPVTGRVLRPTPFYDTTLGFDPELIDEDIALPELNLDRVFILSTSRTCSASEAVINGLRGIDIEVILIGSQTCGKPYGFYPTDNCGETYFTVQFRGANDKGFGDYADGFLPNDGASGFGEQVPGCTLPDEFQGALGNAEEPFLAAAIQFAEDGTCPATTATVKPAQFKTQVSLNPKTNLMNDPRIALDEFMRTNRIYSLTDDVIEGER